MIVASATSGGREIPDYFNFIAGLVVIVAVLGLSVSLASVLARYRYRALGILGIIASALVLVLIPRMTNAR